jgi:hypothetical protein
MRYDPMKDPEADEWRDADETERLLAVVDYHKKARITLPNVRVHAAIHMVVENQLAEGYECAVGALGRLTAAGLNRHEAIHAIGSVVATHMQALLGGAKQGFDEGAYSRDLDALEAAEWRGPR